MMEAFGAGRFKLSYSKSIGKEWYNYRKGKPLSVCKGGKHLCFSEVERYANSVGIPRLKPKQEGYLYV